MLVVYFLITIFLHICLGVYATTVGWIQSPSHGNMQTFVFLGVSNCFSFLFFFSLQVYRVRKYQNKFSRLFIFHYLRGKPKFIWFQAISNAFIWVIANISTVLSFKFASHPSTIQALSLMVPFIIFFFSKLFRVTKTLPRFIFPAFIVSVGGCLMMIFGAAKKAHQENMKGTNNALAILFAVIFDFAISTFFVFQQNICKNYKVPVEALLLLVMQVYAPVSLIISFASKENWKVFKDFGAAEWIALVFLAFGIMCLSRLGQTKMVVAIGAALYSSIQGIRLPATMVSDYVILKADPHWPLQYIGAIIVVISISLFLGYQAYADKKSKFVHFAFDPFTFIYAEEEEFEDEFTLINPVKNAELTYQMETLLSDHEDDDKNNGDKNQFNLKNDFENDFDNNNNNNNNNNFNKKSESTESTESTESSDSTESSEIKKLDEIEENDRK
ncbi:32 kda heat shock protein-related [Anaeramoeba ignava]|uniref:32 kDa heat shock protein-related n=1 Tax=Anaeramoeba ignava TaxID=1746090 RepID=A0A9Q0R6B2_ANAIG|nr:32 kda heat shock protein-related [Anaeramoeba ignava]